MKTEKTIWQKSREELLQELDSTPEGLTGAEAARRLEQYGPNELQEGGRKSVLRIFLEQFADFLVIILILAAVVSALLGDVESTIVILAVITMNAILGTVQTKKAAASLDSLKQMAAPTAKVIRDGKTIQIPGREVTVGDVVVLEAGDSVCADGRLLECASLKTAESALTGESLPVEKELDEIPGDAPLGDRKNMVFSGSFVTYGRGRFLVTATGMDTEMGKIAQLLKNTEERKTPLQVSLDQFGRKLSIIILVICAVLFGVSVLWRHENVMNAFLFAVALAVLAGCSALMGGTVQKDTEQAKALMKEVDPSLTYNTDLEDAASRLADWLVEDSTQLTTQSGLLTRKVPMTTGSGAMLDTNVYDFIDHSTSFLFLPRGVVIGLAMNNEWGFTGYLYAPPLSEAGSALRSYAAGCTQMGAVFIEYGGETYVVAMFA